MVRSNVYKCEVKTTIDELEMIQHEAIKNVFKTYILNCPYMNAYQKQQAMSNVENAVKKTDWIIEMLRQCGYYS